MTGLLIKIALVFHDIPVPYAQYWLRAAQGQAAPRSLAMLIRPFAFRDIAIDADRA